MSASTSLAWGLHAVRVLLERHPERVQRLWLQEDRDDRRFAALRELAAAQASRVAFRPVAELDRLSGGAVHQGVVAELAPSRPLGEADLKRIVAPAGRSALLLVLDGVQDPHNLGACLRSADAASVDAVVAPRDRASGMTPVVRKVAAGAAEVVPFVRVTNLARTLRALKEAGLWVVGADAEGERNLFEADLTGPVAIVLGAEGAGMRRLTREACDFTVRLPMRGVVESLNVSVAAGIILYEALRQRQQAQ